MDRHVTRRILHGLGANAYGQLVVIIIQLAGVPILLHAWGTQLYGEWLILAAIPTYLSMADLGFSQSAGNDMTARMARGDSAGTLAVFQSLSVMVYGLALAGLVLAALLMAWLPLGSWLHFATLSTREVRWVLWLLAAEVLLRLCDGVNHAGFRSHGDYARHVALNASTMLLQNVAAWAAALSGAGLMGAAFALVAVRAIEVPAAAVWLRRRHHDVRLGLAHASVRELRRLIKPAAANLAVPLASAVNVQGMVLVVGALLGPVAVVIFSTSRTLARVGLRMVQAANDAIQPELAHAWGRDNREQLQQLFVRGLRMTVLMALGAVLILHFAGASIVALWTSHRVQFNAALFDWLLLSSICVVTWHGALSLLQAANRHLRAAMWFVLSSGLGLILAYLFMRLTAELAWAGMALVLADLLMLGYVQHRALQMIDLPPRRLLERLIGFTTSHGVA
jgi:O-antigen/teichoic acid export membrane protein